MRELLGRPEKTRFWKNVRPPADADAAAVAEVARTQLDEIWIYRNGRVHFSQEGKVLKVDNKVDLDLPPASPLIA